MFIIPLLLLVLLGFLVKKYSDIEIKTVSKLLIFVLAPMVMFFGGYRVELNAETLRIPVFVVLCFVIMCLISFRLLGIFFPNTGIKYVLSFALSSCNSAYFGIPMLLVLLGEQYLPTLILIIGLILLYENTVGYYLAMRGRFSIKQSLQRVLVLPGLYALLAGFVFNILHISLSEMVTQYIEYFRGAYIVLGMMIIGMGIAGVSLKNFPYKIAITSLVMKILISPAIAIAIILLDGYSTHLLGDTGRLMVLYLSALPLPGNAVALAVQGENHPDTVSIIVFTSTIIGLFLTPALFHLLKSIVL